VARVDLLHARFVQRVFIVEQDAVRWTIEVVVLAAVDGPEE
jgi:hypothetical protein